MVVEMPMVFYLFLKFPRGCLGSPDRDGRRKGTVHECEHPHRHARLPPFMSCPTGIWGLCARRVFRTAVGHVGFVQLMA